MGEGERENDSGKVRGRGCIGVEGGGRGQMGRGRKVENCCLGEGMETEVGEMLGITPPSVGGAETGVWGGDGDRGWRHEFHHLPEAEEEEPEEESDDVNVEIDEEEENNVQSGGNADHGDDADDDNEADDGDDAEFALECRPVHPSSYPHDRDGC